MYFQKSFKATIGKDFPFTVAFIFKFSFFFENPNMSDVGINGVSFGEEHLHHKYMQTSKSHKIFPSMAFSLTAAKILDLLPCAKGIASMSLSTSASDQLCSSPSLTHFFCASIIRKIATKSVSFIWLIALQ
jgi:hypothetical protein